MAVVLCAVVSGLLVTLRLREGKQGLVAVQQQHSSSGRKKSRMRCSRFIGDGSAAAAAGDTLVVFFLFSVAAAVV